jgi:hypothetical protein
MMWLMMVVVMMTVSYPQVKDAVAGEGESRRVTVTAGASERMLDENSKRGLESVVLVVTAVAGRWYYRWLGVRLQEPQNEHAAPKCEARQGKARQGRYLMDEHDGGGRGRSIRSAAAT